MIMSGVMLIILLSTLATLISTLQSKTIRKQLEERGISIARSLSATSIADFLTYNYLALERSANQAAEDPDITANTRIYIPNTELISIDNISITQKSDNTLISKIQHDQSGYLIIPPAGKTVIRELSFQLKN